MKIIQSNLKHLHCSSVVSSSLTKKSIRSSLLNFISTDDRIPLCYRFRFCNLRASSPRYASIVAKIHGWRRKHLPQNVRIFVKCTFEGPCFSFRYYKSSIVKDTIPTWKRSMWSKGRLMKTTKWLGPEI